MSDSGTRLLIATGEVAAGIEELPSLVRVLIEAASEIVVMTPLQPDPLIHEAMLAKLRFPDSLRRAAPL